MTIMRILKELLGLCVVSLGLYVISFIPVWFIGWRNSGLGFGNFMWMHYIDAFIAVFLWNILTIPFHKSNMYFPGGRYIGAFSFGVSMLLLMKFIPLIMPIIQLRYVGICTLFGVAFAMASYISWLIKWLFSVIIMIVGYVISRFIK